MMAQQSDRTPPRKTARIARDYAPRVDKHEARIDWNNPAIDIDVMGRVRPKPGALV